MPTMIDYESATARKAREIVEQWIGEFDPPPQIDFQQSEVLQMLIVRAFKPNTALLNNET